MALFARRVCNLQPILELRPACLLDGLYACDTALDGFDIRLSIGFQLDELATMNTGLHSDTQTPPAQVVQRGLELSFVVRRSGESNAARQLPQRPTALL